MTARFDHLAIAAENLDAGVAAVEEALGMALLPGGHHVRMGTHNRLLSLGPDEYLEVIAIDPDAPAPDHPRWFDLDRFAGRPRPQTWIARCDDMDATLARAPEGAGRPMEFARDDLRWRMAVPTDGRLPFDSLFPALIEWQGARHAAAGLTDTGARLEALALRHPQAEALRAALGPLLTDGRLSISAEPVAISAEIRTPHGLRVLV